MRLKHDNVCLWWKDWHSCSCGFLEEDIRSQRKLIPESLQEISSKIEQTQVCAEVIPGTFIMCGEGVGSERQYCSTYCYNLAKEKQWKP